MRRFFRRSPGGTNLQRELRKHRPEARTEFIASVAARLRGRPAAPQPASRRFGRAGLALAVTGLMLVAFASFGGAGYASSAARDAIKKVQTIVHLKSNPAPRSVSAAQAQYAPPPAPPPTPAPKPKPTPPPPTPPSGGGTQGGTSHGSELPFTGLALWIPAALGLAIFLLGLGLRRLGRRSAL